MYILLTILWAIVVVIAFGLFGVVGGGLAFLTVIAAVAASKIPDQEGGDQ